MSDVPPPQSDDMTPPEGATPTVTPTDEKSKKQKRLKKEKPAKRPILLRIFGVGIWGGIKLLGLCILVGFFIMASNFDPTSPDVQVGAALSQIARQMGDALVWGATHFWKPALAGGAVVMPLWVLWRLLSLPFRK